MLSMSTLLLCGEEDRGGDGGGVPVYDHVKRISISSSELNKKSAEERRDKI